MAKNPTFACCLCCRGVLQPAPEHSDSVENYNILVANVFFMKNAPLHTHAQFCAREEQSHVFQKEQVAPALKYWIDRIENANRWNEVIGDVDNYSYNGASKYVAKWDAPEEEHRIDLGSLFNVLHGDSKLRNSEYIDKTLTCCHVCNIVMDVAGRQNEAFTGSEGIIPRGGIEVHFLPSSTTEQYPLGADKKRETLQLRSAFIAYYIHQCIPVLMYSDQMNADIKKSLKVGVILAWLVFVIFCKNKESGQGAQKVRQQYNYKGNTELYISWFMYLMACYEFGVKMQFEDYHMYLFSEICFLPTWKTQHPGTDIIGYIFKDSSELLMLSSRLVNLYEEFGKKLYAWATGLDTSLLNETDKLYLVTKNEITQLGQIKEMVTKPGNPGAYIRLLGALPMLNPFYRNVDDDTLRNEVRDFIRYHSKSDIARIRALGGEYARWSDARRKLLYQLQFLLEYDEAEVLRQARTLSVPELQRIVDTQLRCSTWKAALRVQRLFPVARAEYADAEAEE